MVNQLGNPLDCPSWFGVNDEDLVGKSRDEFVSPTGGTGVGAARGLLEARHDEKASAFQCRPPFGRNPHFSHRPRRTYDNGPRSLKENLQALFLDRRMKAADQRHAFILELSAGIVSTKSGGVRATNRAE
jgi:hypothetical protein